MEGNHPGKWFRTDFEFREDSKWYRNKNGRKLEEVTSGLEQRTKLTNAQ